MTNYTGRLALLGLLTCAAPAFCATFIAPRAAAVPGGVVTFKLPGTPDEKPVVKYGDRPVLVARHAEGWIADQPNSPGLALTLGRLCIQCKLWGKAREYLERGLAIEPSPALWEALGDCSSGREERDLAALCYRNALRAARGEPTEALPGLTGVPAALSTRASVIETRSAHGVPQLPGIAHE